MVLGPFAPRSSDGPIARVLLALCVISLPIISVSPPARAAPSAADRELARTKMKEGSDLLAGGKPGQALARFEEAYAVFPSPKIFYSMALSLDGLGRHAEAYNYFNRFIQEVKDPGSAEQIKHSRQQVEKLNRAIGFLQLVCDLDGAEVYLSGRRLGATPLAARVAMDPGEHELVVKADGVPPDIRRVSVIGGVLSSVRVELKGRQSSSSLTPPNHAATAPGTLPSPTTPPGGLEPPQPTRPGSGAGPDDPQISRSQPMDWRRPAAWIALAAGAGTLGFAVYNTIVFATKVDQFNSLKMSDNRTDACDTNHPMKGYHPSCLTWHNEGQDALKWSLIGYGVTAALGAAAVVLFVTSSPSSATSAGGPRGSHTAWSCGVGGLSATCRFTF